MAAYGGPGLRRHSMRLSGEPSRRRVSRFLRSDFFDAPADESVYARRKKEKELETQKILKEIREKRNRSLEASSGRSPTEITDAPTFKDESAFSRKCLSPVGLLTAKERSRSTTPFFPILDNIKETVLDTSHITSTKKTSSENGVVRPTSRLEDSTLTRDSKLIRPKSYPVKDIDSVDDSPALVTESNKENECSEKMSQKESKIIRPKSYPTSSPSPEKVYINRSINKKDESRNSAPKEETSSSDVKGDIEVSFSITLPKKKAEGLTKLDSLKNSESLQQNVDTNKNENGKIASDSLVIKKYHIVNNTESTNKIEQKAENGSVIANGGPKEVTEKTNSNSEDKSNKVTVKKEDVKLKSTEGETNEKKGTIKKKIIRKVSSKSKTDLGSNSETGENKAATTEKKKVTKKVKEKTVEDGTKSTGVTKKKSMLQSIGHKLEKLATKSNSPEKAVDNSAVANSKNNEVPKLNRTQREHSVPVGAEPSTESNLIKRAVTLTDVAALETQNATSTKTTVSKVLGLFKKFEPKEKPPKTLVEKSQSDNLDINPVNSKPEIVTESVSDSLEKDKPRRPTSLLLNGLGRKNKYGRTASDSVSAVSVENDDQAVLKKETEPKNLRNTLKLDFSRLPRVKKIVPTNPVIEPQLINVSDDKNVDKKNLPEKNGTISDSITSIEPTSTQSRSRSRSRSTISEQKSDLSADGKSVDKHSVSPSDTTVHHPLRNHESTTPEKEDVVDRIRRKSFYSRFNEKKQRRKSSLVGPGAAEYDPLSRIHSPPTETKFDVSPTSPSTYDLSPGYSIASDLSPSTERYRTLLADLPISSRNNLRYDNYGLNDKMDTYRSLDRNEFRKYPNSRSYLDYDQPSSYGTNRYSRTKSLLDSSDGTEESCLGLRDPQKYSRTLSMYSPGNYATYRPKRTRNSAIILKESEKEPSPENILEKIRQRKKISISVTRKPDSEKDPLPRCVSLLYLRVHVNNTIDNNSPP